jgi:ribonuclease HII
MDEFTPTLEQELKLWRAGYRCVAGVDEAGRGALAGPVVAAAVVLPPGIELVGVWAEVRDSKLLTPERRATLAEEIRAAALTCATGEASAEMIDRYGIAAATKIAMAAAIANLDPQPDFLLIDWVRLPLVNVAQQSFVKADRHIASVAAASILAKVHRDQLMAELDGRVPCYGFARHKGYATRQHLDAIDVHGPCAEHRKSFAPIAQMPSLFDLVERAVDRAEETDAAS